MISTLTPITLPPDASDDAHNLALQFNQRLQEIELHLASLKGSDGQQASLSSDLDLSNKRVKNALVSRSYADAITRKEVKQSSAIRQPGTLSAQVANLTVNNLQVNQGQIIDANQVAAIVQAALSNSWPVGAVFPSVVSTNPATLLGFGTWTQIAQGQFLVGQKGTDTDFDTPEETGGSKTHTHAVDVGITVTGAPSGEFMATSGTAAYAAYGDHTHQVDPASVTSGNNSALPPYFVLYLWKRTA